MIKVGKQDIGKIRSLFDGIEDSMVIACIQGYMGSAFVDTLPNPKVSLIVSGEYSFFGGDPLSKEALPLAEKLFDFNESDETVGIFADDRPEWKDVLMSIAENNPVIVPRYGIVQKDYEFDEEQLQKFIDSLPAQYDLVPFDENIYRQAMCEEWSKEFCETFDSAADYLKRGFGFAAMDHGKLVSGASTMTVYDGGAEVQVATHPDYRRRGLVMPCAAAFLRESMNRKTRPCWDAANLISKKMALQLGYEYKGEYLTVHMSKSRPRNER